MFCYVIDHNAAILKKKKNEALSIEKTFTLGNKKTNS